MAKETSENPVWETIKTVFYALLIAGVFRTLFFQPFWIPSGSMKDTLLVGDFLFVNKMAYGYSYASCPSVRIPAVGLNVDAHDICGVFDGDNGRFLGGEPERGDVVVFRHPANGTDYIKRLVGLPGEKLQVLDGVLHINGVAAPQTDAGVFTEVYAPQGPQGRLPSCANSPVGQGADCNKLRRSETLPGGVTHSVLDIANRLTDNTPIYTIPEGHYFFMGDNRDNSVDSRVARLSGGVGYVPYENLIGRADRIVISSSGRSMLAFWTWRGDRIFKAVK